MVLVFLPFTGFEDFVYPDFKKVSFFYFSDFQELYRYLHSIRGPFDYG